MTSAAQNRGVIDILAHVDELKEENTLLSLVSQPPRQFLPSTLIIMFWSVVALIIAPMVMVSLPNPIVMIQDQHYEPIVYCMQIPAAIFVAGFLGARFGTVTIAMYLLMGILGLPVFANGGGPYYFSDQVSSGYLIGLLLCPIAIERTIIQAYVQKGWLKGRSLWILLGALLSVLIIHGFGALGIGVYALMHHMSAHQAVIWLTRLSETSILYDVVFGIMALASIRIFRLLFNPCLY